MATTWKSSLKDSIYKPIYNKTTTPAEKEIRATRKKKKKDEDEEMNWEKIRPPRPCEPGGLDCASPRSTTQAARALGRASLTAWAARPGSRNLSRPKWVARPGSREPQAARLGLARASSFSPSPIWLIWLFLSLWSGLPLSDLTLSLSDLIRSSEVRLCLRLWVFFF